jgi:hypothetical protein
MKQSGRETNGVIAMLLKCLPDDPADSLHNAAYCDWRVYPGDKQYKPDTAQENRTS